MFADIGILVIDGCDQGSFDCFEVVHGEFVVFGPHLVCSLKWTKTGLSKHESSRIKSSG